MPFNDPNQPKALRIQLTAEKHRQLKILAAKLETTMDKLVNQLIEQRIEEDK